MTKEERRAIGWVVGVQNVLNVAPAGPDGTALSITLNSATRAKAPALRLLKTPSVAGLAGTLSP